MYSSRVCASGTVEGQIKMGMMGVEVREEDPVPETRGSHGIPAQRHCGTYHICEKKREKNVTSDCGH